MASLKHQKHEKIEMYSLADVNAYQNSENSTARNPMRQLVEYNTDSAFEYHLLYITGLL